jgi:hypothetical protein
VGDRYKAGDKVLFRFEGFTEEWLPGRVASDPCGLSQLVQVVALSPEGVSKGGSGLPAFPWNCYPKEVKPRKLKLGLVPPEHRADVRPGPRTL